MSLENKIDLSNMKMKEIRALTADFYNDKLIFSANFEQLCKHFLSKVLPINVWSEDFSKVRSIYIENSKYNEKEVPNNDDEFYKYIVKNYFDLVREPYQVLLSTYQRATKDLKEIDDRIAQINNDINKIKVSEITKDIQEKIPLLKYFSDANKQVRNDLLQFLKTGIYDYVLSECEAQEVY